MQVPHLLAPKVPLPILTGQVALRVGELIRQIAAANEVEIITDEMIQQYIRNQHEKIVDDEDFKITSTL